MNGYRCSLTIIFYLHTANWIIIRCFMCAQAVNIIIYESKDGSNLPFVAFLHSYIQDVTKKWLVACFGVCTSARVVKLISIADNHIWLFEF